MSYRSARESGVALAIVVWFIAGMSLLVAGIVSHARVDTRMTQVHLGRAKAVAAGDGAIQLAMLARQSGYESSNVGPLVSEGIFQVGDSDVTVRLYPASGFVDLNSAPAQLLAILFADAGKLPPGEAKLIADNVVKWRSAGGAGNGRILQRQRFHALEDLLRIEGVNRGLLDAIRDLVVAGDWYSGAMDWSASPESMVEMLGELNPGQLDSVQRRRGNLSRGPEGSSRRAIGGGGTFRADALVSYGGRTWLRRRWVEQGSAPGSQLPWRVVRTEPPRVIEG